MKIALLQSNYIPWKGYFDMISEVDAFVLYDEVQYTKNDWRNRNKIKSAAGEVQWLTIPVRVKGLDQRICDTVVSMPNWKKKHWKTLQAAYGRAEHFKALGAMVESWYADIPSENLSEINRYFIELICEFLEIETPILDSRDYSLEGDKQGRIISLCQQLKADKYLSGPAAKSYIELQQFSDAGITVEWMSYSGYPEYAQRGNEFEHGLSIFDLMFNEGQRTKQLYQKTL